MMLGACLPAAAQSGCDELAKHLTERKTIAEGLGGKGQGNKRQIDAKVACAGFGRLVANGTTLIKWAEANREWCRIPDSFMEGVKADHQKALGIRSQACNAAAKIQQMEKQAREGGGGGGLLGGGGLTGSTRIPSGAL